MINAKRMFILVFTCLFSLSINNVYAQNHDSLTIHSYYLDVNNHLSNISGDHIALIKIADYDGNNYHVLEKYSKLVTINKDMTASEQNGVATKLMDYIQKNNIDYDEEVITNQKGEATFRDLDYGIYLIYEHNESEFAYKSEPFIISIPFLEKEDDGSYEEDYDVDVEPKYSIIRPGIDEEPDDDSKEEPDDKIPSNDENFKKEKNFSQTSNYKDNQKLKTGDYYNPEYWLLLMIMSIIIFFLFNKKNFRH
ncbi:MULTISPECIES: pilin N-terminal domain-containing protein [unclassified Faecalibacillus]|uniref:pilin N-terminal domain-containing protein n=1 Tax=unclassified Faecalibacillus TaxID=2678890 RepID=UPI001D0BAD8C|nr:MULTISPECIES: pilin N-terminal domain-containing protein [unclassified Faecalibacillus]MCB8540402.1 hypothetical protein [Faecalibacillus sp. TM498]MCB8558316.1 hypothetical protein [Faecalibacillus sp. TM111]